jgi:hypothetical protein
MVKIFRKRAIWITKGMFLWLRVHEWRYVLETYTQEELVLEYFGLGQHNTSRGSPSII